MLHTLDGIGLRSGRAARVTFLPIAGPFAFSVAGVTTPLRDAAVVDADRATTLRLGSSTVATVEHLLAAGRLDDAVELLTGLPWIEAKCKAKLVFSLQDDYRNTITTIPEAQEGLRQERERQARLARWTEDITAYSRQWSERRDRLARRAALTDSEPRLPEPPAKCRMWTDEEIRAASLQFVRRHLLIGNNC